MSASPDIHDPKYSDVGAWVRYHNEILAKQKAAGKSRGLPQFGRFTGLPKSLPTMNEFGVTNFLDANRIPYTTHERIKHIDPDFEGGHNSEFDIYVPSLALAIELNPAWHLGGKSEIPSVAALDRAKQRSAKRSGIELVALDPAESPARFAHEVNTKLIPYLRSQGLNVRNWEEHLTIREIAAAQRTNRRLRK